MRPRQESHTADRDSGPVCIAAVGDVYHCDDGGLVVDAVDDPVRAAPRAEAVVQRWQ
jgi:hypothetical protein